jgi:hypothetical protein
MPFICLANANVPDGTVQITDLWPNESQRNQSIDPPGQNRYLSRPAGDLVALAGAGPITLLPAPAISDQFVIEGLEAYIADRVDPGGSEAATGTMTLAGVLVGDTITYTGPGGVLTQVYTAVENTATGSIVVGDPTAAVGRLTVGLSALSCVEDDSTGVGVTPNTVLVGDAITIAGVLFTAAGAADIPNQIFDQSGTDQQTSNSLVLAINHANAQALLTAALDALVVAPTAGTLVATNAGGAAVAITLTPSVLGVWGDAAIVQTVGGATLTPVSLTHTAPNPAAVPSEFGSAAYYEGTNADVSIPVATSIVAAINDAANQILIAANYAGPAPAALFGTVTGASGGTATVTLTPSLPGFSGQLDMSTTEAGQLVLSAATLVNVNANPALFQFDSLINSTLGTDITSATSLAAALNNATSDVALGTTIGGSTVTASNVGGTSAVVTSLADTAGSVGAMGITESTAGVRVVVSAGAMAKTMVTWTAALINASAAAVQALVDAGTACTVVLIDAAMNAVVGVSGISIATGTSSLADILSILAGRAYQVPVPVVKDVTGTNWSTVATGSFTGPNTTWDTGMLSGEWGATTAGRKALKTGGGLTNPTFLTTPAGAAGGDVVNNELAGVRSTYDGTHFQASVNAGQLFRLSAGVTLFPDPEVQAWSSRTAGSPTALQRQATLVNQRVVTVLDDDGSLLV